MYIMYYYYIFDGRSIECDIDPEVIATSRILSEEESTVTSDQSTTATHVTANGQLYLFYKLPHKVNMSIHTRVTRYITCHPNRVVHRPTVAIHCLKTICPRWKSRY